MAEMTPDSTHRPYDLAILGQIEREIHAATVYRNMWRNASEHVDAIFQEDGSKHAILPDFLKLGDDKFEGCVVLARRYAIAVELLREIMPEAGGKFPVLNGPLSDRIDDFLKGEDPYYRRANGGEL